ncbi:MAG: rubrerythrin family protein [Candidatus Anammoxibacter sp.]
MSTIDNLTKAFEGESWAIRKYHAFAEKAEEEGFKHAARLFRALETSETAHANIHLKQIGAVLSTKENITYARDLEASVAEEMYPEMLEEAVKEGNKRAAQGFEHIKNVEKGHVDLCQKALNSLGNDEVIEYYVCQYCGNVVETIAPDSCPICDSTKDMYQTIS